MELVPRNKQRPCSMRTAIIVACGMVGLTGCVESFREVIPVGTTVRRDLDSATCQAVASHEFFDGLATLVDETRDGRRCRLRVPATADSLHQLGISLSECDSDARVDVIVDIDGSWWQHNPEETGDVENTECTVA